MLQKITAFLVFLIPFALSAQALQLSESAEISVLTMGAGNDALYETFGHNAFRIKDESNGFDRVYDYGRFDFNTSNFYLKFARGKLLYQLGTSPTLPFVNFYASQDRNVKEQVLNLTQAEKQELATFLQYNALPENRDYKYDFFYDNCATRIRDVLVKILGDKINYNDDYITHPATFRTLIHENLSKNTWGSVGIDIALGAVVDREATPWEHQFLPKYVFLALDKATLSTTNSTQALVKQTNILFEAPTKTITSNFFLSPLFIFLILALGITYVTFKNVKTGKRTKRLDTFLFLVTGLAGMLLTFLWWGTDHSATANNYNLLWAFPLNAILIFVLFKKNKWNKNYVFLLLLMLGLMIVHGFTGVQVFPIVMIPFWIALGVRYSYLFKVLKNQK